MFHFWLAKEISTFWGGTYRVEISSSHWKNNSQHGSELWRGKYLEMGRPPDTFFFCIKSTEFMPAFSLVVFCYGIHPLTLFSGVGGNYFKEKRI